MARNLNADEIHRRGTRRAAAHEICKRSLGRKSSIRKHTKAGIWARPVSSYYYWCFLERKKFASCLGITFFKSLVQRQKWLTILCRDLELERHKFRNWKKAFTFWFLVNFEHGLPFRCRPPLLFSSAVKLSRGFCSKVEKFSFLLNRSADTDSGLLVLAWLQ